MLRSSLFYLRMAEARSYYLMADMWRKWGGGLKQEQREHLGKLLSSMTCSDTVLYIGERKDCASEKRDLYIQKQRYDCIQTEVQKMLKTKVKKLKGWTLDETRLEEVIVENEDQVKKAREDIKKHNQVVVEAKRREQAAKTFGQVQSLLREGREMVSIDVEAYERDSTRLLEIGTTIFNQHGIVGQPQHFIIQENLTVHNGRYVPDNRYCFNYGLSMTVPQATAFEVVENLINRTEIIVGLGFQSDVDFLKSSGFAIPGSAVIYDLDALCKHRLKSSEAVGLERLLKASQIEFYNLHNAGNDAYYTMILFLEMVKRENWDDVVERLVIDKQKRIAKRAANKAKQKEQKEGRKKALENSKVPAAVGAGASQKSAKKETDKGQGVDAASRGPGAMSGL